MSWGGHYSWSAAVRVISVHRLKPLYRHMGNQVSTNSLLFLYIWSPYLIAYSTKSTLALIKLIVCIGLRNRIVRKSKFLKLDKKIMHFDFCIYRDINVQFIYQFLVILASFSFFLYCNESHYFLQMQFYLYRRIQTLRAFVQVRFWNKFSLGFYIEFHCILFKACHPWSHCIYLVNSDQTAPYAF